MNPGPSWIDLVALAGGGILALAGLGLLWWALLWDRARGRRRCPRCWYNLAGTPGNLTCSECGRTTKTERQLFRTRRRWRWAALALVVLAACPALIGWQQTRKFNWNNYKPVWLLMYEADGPSQTAHRARLELFDRMEAGNLNAEQTTRIVEHALALQSDPNSFWRTNRVGGNWGDLVECAWFRGELSDDQIERYARHAFDLTYFYKVRPKVRQGERAPKRNGVTEPRVSLLWHAPGRWPRNLMCIVLPRARTPDSPLTNSEPSLERMVHRADRPGMSSGGLLRSDLPIGHHREIIDVEYLAVSRPIDRTTDWTKIAALDEVPDPLARWTREVEVRFEVVPADQSTVALKPDEGLRAQIVGAILPEFRTQSLVTKQSTYNGRNGMILVSPVPVNLSFDVFARVGGAQQKIGAISVPANERRITNAQIIRKHPRELFPGAESFDLILRSAPEAAEQTVDIMEAWDGEIVIENVSLIDAASESPSEQK